MFAFGFLPSAAEATLVHQWLPVTIGPIGTTYEYFGHFWLQNGTTGYQCFSQMGEAERMQH